MAGGTIGILSLELSRYTSFHESAMAVNRPKHTHVLWAGGKSTGLNYVTGTVVDPVKDIIDKQNFLASHMRGDWLWILGDDHTFGEDSLLSLLKHFDKHGVDIVCPVNISRKKPFWPLIFDEDGKALGWEVLDGKKGLVPVPACGNAGMLIRRKVFEKIRYPWFQWAPPGSPYDGSDLSFCWKARQAGFTVWLDTDLAFGHTTTATFIPRRGPDGAFGAFMEVQGQPVSYFRMTGKEENAVMWVPITMEKTITKAEAALPGEARPYASGHYTNGTQEPRSICDATPLLIGE